MESIFKKMKKDLKKGIAEGFSAVKEGVNTVSEKMNELTEESKRQYKMVDLKMKIQNQLTELGARTYDVLNKNESPATDKKAKAIMGKIKKLEMQLRKLEAGKKRKIIVRDKSVIKTKTTPKSITKTPSKKSAQKTVRKISTYE